MARPVSSRRTKKEKYGTAHVLCDLIERVDRSEKISVRQICKDYPPLRRAAAERYIAFVKKRRKLVGTVRGGETFWTLAAGGGRTKSFDEAVAHELCLRSAEWLLGTPYHDLLSNRVLELRAACEPGAQDRLETFVRSFCHRTQGDASYSRQLPQIERLLAAIRDRRRCTLEYEREVGVTKTYDIEPSLLVLYKDRLYLLGRTSSTERRTFALELVSSVRVHDDAPSFAIPDARQTDPGYVFRHSFGVFTDYGPPATVELEVTGSAARTLRRRHMHEPQDFEPIGDGWYRVRWTVAICPELRSFVLSLLPDVRVRNPPELRTQILESLRPFVDGSLSDPAASVSDP